MNESTRARLMELNREFYRVHARTFSATRTRPWGGWEQVGASFASVLDLGCGNGRYLRYLRSTAFKGRYVGVDECAALLEQGDAASELVQRSVDEEWPAGPFDAVVAWGLLHHIPSFTARLSLLERMIAASSHLVAVSLWQHRHLSRQELAPERFGIDVSELEEGDSLLGWQNDATVARYCHHFGDNEVEAIRKALGRPTRVFRSEGSDRSNVYLEITKSAA